MRKMKVSPQKPSLVTNVRVVRVATLRDRLEVDKLPVFRATEQVAVVPSQPATNRHKS